MAIKVNFFCTYTFFFVPLHHEPALGMSAHQRRRVADIIKRRLLALVLEIRNPAKFHKPKTRRFHAFCIFISTGCLEPMSHKRKTYK